jgi:hypothetical protein
MRWGLVEWAGMTFEMGVMPGLVPGIHAFDPAGKAWMAGTLARLRASSDALCQAMTEIVAP